MQAISGFHVNHIFFLLKHRSKRDSSPPQENVCLLPVPFIRTASENSLPIVAVPFMLGASETERAAYCSISFYTRSVGEQSVCAYCIIPLHAWRAREQSACRTIGPFMRGAPENSLLTVIALRVGSVRSTSRNVCPLSRLLSRKKHQHAAPQHKQSPPIAV